MRSIAISLFLLPLSLRADICKTDGTYGSTSLNQLSAFNSQLVKVLAPQELPHEPGVISVNANCGQLPSPVESSEGFASIDGVSAPSQVGKALIDSLSKCSYSETTANGLQVEKQFIDSPVGVEWLKMVKDVGLVFTCEDSAEISPHVYGRTNLMSIDRCLGPGGQGLPSAFINPLKVTHPKLALSTMMHESFHLLGYIHDGKSIEVSYLSELCCSGSDFQERAKACKLFFGEKTGPEYLKDYQELVKSSATFKTLLDEAGIPGFDLPAPNAEGEFALSKFSDLKPTDPNGQLTTFWKIENRLGNDFSSVGNSLNLKTTYTKKVAEELIRTSGAWPKDEKYNSGGFSALYKDIVHSQLTSAPRSVNAKVELCSPDLALRLYKANKSVSYLEAISFQNIYSDDRLKLNLLVAPFKRVSTGVADVSNPAFVKFAITQIQNLDSEDSED